MSRVEETTRDQPEIQDVEAAVLQAVLRALKTWAPLETGAEALLRDLAEALDLPAATLWIPAHGALKPAACWSAHASEEAGSGKLTTGIRRLAPNRDLATSAWGHRQPLYRSGSTSGRPFDGASGQGWASLPAFVAIPAKTKDEVLGVAAAYGAPDMDAGYPTLAFLDIVAGFLGELLDRWRFQEEHSKLTAREKEMLTLASQGLTTVAIADRLTLSPWTVKTHFEHIRLKLQVPDRTAAVALALRNGVIE